MMNRRILVAGGLVLAATGIAGAQASRRW